MFSRISNKLSTIPRIACPVDDPSELAFVPERPLPAKSFCMYIVGAPGSGKTNLWQSLLTSKKPRYYWKLFDSVHLISASMGTLSKQVTSKLPDNKKHDQFEDSLLEHIVESLRIGPNGNNLIILDDVIKDLKRSKILSKVFLNRRHCTHSTEQPGNGGLAVMVTSQKYTLLPLEMRTACSHVIVFKSQNRQEIDRIKDELMFDLSPDLQDTLLQEAWAESHSFLLIIVNAPRGERYFIKFDQVVF
jgi:hypothetical protein